MRVAHVNVVRPRDRPTPDALLDRWPTLGAVAGAVARAGAEVTVIQPFHRTAEAIRDGVRYRFVAEPALPGRATGFMPWRLAAAVRAAEPDAIHVNGLDFAGHIRALSRLGPPVLVQDHASAADIGVRRRRWGLAEVAGVAFTDVRQAEPFARLGAFPPGVRLFSIPESSSRFAPGDRDAARAATGVHGDPALLWVGRLDANKDPLAILDAVALAMCSLPELRLWCCFHEQPLLAQVEARLTADPELAARVHLLGRVPHPRVETLARAADFFLLGSHHEGSGYALIEGLACGLTPIVSDIPSFRRITDEGRIGALATVGDPASFAAALLRMAARPRDRLRRDAIAHFERALSFDAVGQALCAAYRDLIGLRG